MTPPEQTGTDSEAESEGEREKKERGNATKNHPGWTGVDEGGRELMRVDGSWWSMRVGGSGWEWMGLNESGWDLMRVDGT
jgi:hypothetical protein